MRITQTYIMPQDKSSEPLKRSKYQMMCNYLSLPISAWIAGKKLDLGKFNRIVFEEGTQEDFAVVGNNALVVGIAKEFTSLEASSWCSRPRSWASSERRRFIRRHRIRL